MPAHNQDLDALTTTLSPAEVARRLHVSKGYLANMRVAGTGPRYVKIGRICRYRPSDIEAYLDAQTRTSTSDPGPARDEKAA